MKREKNQTLKIRDSFSSAGGASSDAPRRSHDGGSSSSMTHRPRSTFGRASIEIPPLSKTPYSRESTSSPYIATARLSSNVSCRKPRLPSRDLSTTSSRLKQRNIPGKEQAKRTSMVSTRRPRKSLSAEVYLSNRPSSLLATDHDKQKENSGASLVNQIRCRAQKKREHDGEDESSKVESRATTYRTPLTYGNSVATAADDRVSTSSKPRYPHTVSSENVLESNGILDISISLPFEDVLSPLSATSVAASPASTISSNEIVKPSNDNAERHESQRPMSPAPPFASSAIEVSSDPQSLLFSGQQHDAQNSGLLSPRSTAKSRQSAASIAAQSERASPNADAFNNKDTTKTTLEKTPDGIGVNNTNTLDFQGIEDDDSVVAETVSDRRRRRRDSTFLILPTPKQSISPNPVKSAFVPVGRRQSIELVQDESPLDQGSPGLLSSKSEHRIVTDADEVSPTQSTGDADESEATVTFSYDVARVNDRAVLEAIPESRGASEESSRLELENKILREEVEALRITNCNLERKLHAIRHAYEERVTPFRDVFEDVSAIMELKCE